MLKALLHRKLPRGIVQSDSENDEDDRPHVEPTRREDPLTATIFERLAYLPPGMTWDILRRATKPLIGGATLPPEAPSGAPVFSFWPNLRPSAEGRNKLRVEPDVLISCNDTLLVVEAKHYGQQYANQWIEQIRAVRAMPEHWGKRIWLVAVGGIVANEQREQAAHVRREITNSSPELLALRWDELHHAIDEFRNHNCPPEQLAILNDITAGLDAWGYRKKTWFSSLRASGPSFQSKKAMAALQTWRVR